ncbi:MAG: hypothetical protein OHK0057_13720 [Thermoflexibacter sp.]
MQDVYPYGRQYLISNKKLILFDDWKVASITDSLHIHFHHAIEQSYYQKEKVYIYLLGYMLNPRNPSQTNEDILKELSQYTDIHRFISATSYYGGRYLLLYSNASGSYIVPDSLAYREAYYYFDVTDFYIASQPKLIAKFIALEERKDPDFLNFVNSQPFQNLNIKSYIGEVTHFKEVKHLLPNHYLDIGEKRTKRFWFGEDIAKDTLSITEAVTEVANLVKGLTQAMASRHQISIAFTSGWDSRLTVAASREIKDEVLYYVNQYPHMTHKTPDITVPKKLSAKLGIDFHIYPIEKNPTEAFRKAYLESYDYPVESLLNVHYTRYKTGQGRITTLTIGSEIGRGSKMARSFYESNLSLTPLMLSKLAYYGENQFAMAQCKDWLENQVNQVNTQNIHLVDLFFWEQRIGNWGARSATLADFYRETFTVFNCRELLIKMLSLPPKYRQHDSILYTKVMELLWKDILSLPINPPANFKEWLKKKLRDFGVFNYLKVLKYKKMS